MSWIQFALISAVFSSALGILSNETFKYKVDSTLYSLIRAIIIVIVLIPYIIFYAKIDLKNPFQSYTAVYITIISGLVGAVSWVTYYESMASGSAKGHVTVTAITAINYSYIIPIFIYDILVSKKKMTNEEFYVDTIGCIIIILGVLLISFKSQLISKLSS